MLSALKNKINANKIQNHPLDLITCQRKIFNFIFPLPLSQRKNNDYKKQDKSTADRCTMTMQCKDVL
jgi:hypothetical protein